MWCCPTRFSSINRNANHALFIRVEGQAFPAMHYLWCEQSVDDIREMFLEVDSGVEPQELTVIRTLFQIP